MTSFGKPDAICFLTISMASGGSSAPNFTSSEWRSVRSARLVWQARRQNSEASTRICVMVKSTKRSHDDGDQHPVAGRRPWPYHDVSLAAIGQNAEGYLDVCIASVRPPNSTPP